MSEERIEAFLAKAEAAREKLGDDMPSALVIETALRGMLNSRTGRMLARAKTFRENPLGSLLHRLVSWHGSGGGLWSMFEAQGDAWLLAEFNPEKAGAYWTHEKSKMAEHTAVVCAHGDLDGNQLYEQLLTLSIVLCGGKSNAAQQWAKVLGR